MNQNPILVIYKIQFKKIIALLVHYPMMKNKIISALPNKWCYVEYNSEVNICQALDEAKIDDYINLMKQSIKNNGGDESGLKAIFSSSSTSSNQRFVRVNNILFFIISLILFWTG